MQIICGLILSKFGVAAVEALGFTTFSEAFNVLGAALSAPPSTIKNYRDELDPYFPNERKGWHSRPLRKHCAAVLTAYRDMSLGELTMIVRKFFDPTSDLAPTGDDPFDLEQHSAASFAKRLVTGQAAEGFFRMNYRDHEEFASGTIVDTTAYGCGFDFRVNLPDSFCAVEVKGIHAQSGDVLLTQKEYSRAIQLRDRFYLYVVRGFSENPFASVWRDPLHSMLDWRAVSTTKIVTSWRTDV